MSSLSFSAKSHLQSLQSEKLVLESRIRKLTSENIDGVLVDESGFPRSDVDVHRIREVRNELARAQNDYKSLMNKIENALVEFHRLSKIEKEKDTKKTDSDNNKNNSDSNMSSASIAPSVCLPSECDPAEKKVPCADTAPVRSEFDAPRVNSNSNSSSSVTSTSTSTSPSPSVSLSTPHSLTLSSVPQHLEAFYTVDEVYAHSPASEAGLCVGDEILCFGTLTKENYSASAMATVTQASISRPLRVVVKRKEIGTVIIQIIPRKWNGSGLLGCHLI